MQIIKFITLTKNGKIVHINVDNISAIAPEDGYTRVYIVGDEVPFEIEESASQILAKINERT